MRNTLLVVTVCFFLVLSVVVPMTSHAESKPKGWEYKSLVRERVKDINPMVGWGDWSTSEDDNDVSSSKLSLAGYLNRLGGNGWELVSAVSIADEWSSTNSNRVYYLFKRPK